MKQTTLSVVALMLVIGSVMPMAVRAEDQSSYVPAGSTYVPAGPSQIQPAYPAAYPAYQPPPNPVPSGNIIGYQPITNSALEAAMSGATRAPSAATPAYQPAGAYGAGGSGPIQVNVASSQPHPAAAPGTLPAGYLTGVVGEGFYTLGRDDVIQVDVRNQPEFSGVFVIGFDGKIQYNYLNDIPVAGLTKYEVQQVLEKLLQRFVRAPLVNVTIVAYNSKVVYVIGEVNAPGKFIMRGDAIKLREAILAAGLPTKVAALSRVHVIKPDLENPDIRVINVKRILYKGALKDDIDLTTGEVVVVPSTVWSIVNNFVSGIFSPVTRAARMAALAAL